MSLSLSSSLHRQVNVSLPEETRANGTLYAVVYVHKAGVSPLEDSREVHYAAQLTTYIAPTHAEGQRDSQKVTQKVKRDSLSLSHHHVSAITSTSAAHSDVCGLCCQISYFCGSVPPEAESQIRDSRVPLETSPVNHHDVGGLHLQQGGASQRRAALHESVSHAELWRSKPGDQPECC